MKSMTQFFRTCIAKMQLEYLRIVNIMRKESLWRRGEPQSSDHMKGKLEVIREVDTNSTWLSRLMPAAHHRFLARSALGISEWASNLASMLWGVLMPGERFPNAAIFIWLNSSISCAEQRAQFQPVLWFSTF